MDKYSVKLMSRALRDLDGIYNYIAHTLLEPGTALNLVGRVEDAILSLETMPYRCPERKRGERRLGQTHAPLSFCPFETQWTYFHLFAIIVSIPSYLFPSEIF